MTVNCLPVEKTYSRKLEPSRHFQVLILVIYPGGVAPNDWVHDLLYPAAETWDKAMLRASLDQ